MKAELDTERREAPNWPPNCTWRSHLGPLACAQWCKSLHNDLLLGIVILGTLAASGRRQQLHHYNGTRTTPLWLSSNKPLNCQVLRKCGSESQLKNPAQNWTAIFSLILILFNPRLLSKNIVQHLFLKKWSRYASMQQKKKKLCWGASLEA